MSYQLAQENYQQVHKGERATTIFFTKRCGVEGQETEEGTRGQRRQKM
jgi:antirestriction protein ArdC